MVWTQRKTVLRDFRDIILLKLTVCESRTKCSNSDPAWHKAEGKPGPGFVLMSVTAGGAVVCTDALPAVFLKTFRVTAELKPFCLGV